MLINTNLPIPAGATADARPRAIETNPADSQNSGTDAADAVANRLSSLDVQGDSGTDSSMADQALGFLRSNMFAQSGMMFAAQANLNPQTVYNLLN